MAKTKTHNLLCVDDESDNVDALERLFRKKYNVFKATTAQAGLEILAKNPMAVIVSDQRMPGMTGVEMLAESIKTHPDTIRILLTGYTDIDSVIAAINSGHIYRYVTKPWDSVDLSNAVDKAVERYELGLQLAEKNRELEVALRELQQLDQAKSHFMILVNHELKTPLTSILSYTELLRETRLDNDQTLYVNRILSSAKRLHVLVNDVLELVSAEAKTVKLQMQKVSAKDIFSSLPEVAGELAKSRQIDFNFDIEDATLWGDEKALRNIFRRLTHNAAKFGFTGQAVKVVGRVLEGGSYLLSIENPGPSLDSTRIQQILKPFTLNENIMNHTSGTGLGLSICHSLLRLHASSLHVSSQDEQIRVSFQLAIK